jgi:hypothetical protein
MAKEPDVKGARKDVGQHVAELLRQRLIEQEPRHLTRQECSRYDAHAESNGRIDGNRFERAHNVSFNCSFGLLKQMSTLAIDARSLNRAST